MRSFSELCFLYISPTISNVPKPIGTVSKDLDCSWNYLQKNEPNASGKQIRTLLDRTRPDHNSIRYLETPRGDSPEFQTLQYESMQITPSQWFVSTLATIPFETHRRA